MTEFRATIETIPITQKDRQIIVGKNSNFSYKTHKQVGKNDFVYKTRYHEAKQTNGETFESPGRANDFTDFQKTSELKKVEKNE